jgi:serine/threonine-protein kinase
MAAAARVAVDAPPSTSVMQAPVGHLPRRAGVIPMGGPPAGVAEPATAAPHMSGQPGSPQYPASPPGIDLGAVGAPPASKPGMNPMLIKVLAGVVALVVLGGMVLLLLNTLNGGGEPLDGNTETPTVTEESAEEDTSPEAEQTTPDDQQGQTGDGPGLGDCIGANCD